MSNCNRIAREGRCDSVEWTECTFCGAIDNELCRNIQKPELPRIDSTKYARNALKSIANGLSPEPYELVALVMYLMRRIEALESMHNEQSNPRSEAADGGTRYV